MPEQMRRKVIEKKYRKIFWKFYMKRWRKKQMNNMLTTAIYSCILILKRGFCANVSTHIKLQYTENCKCVHFSFSALFCCCCLLIYSFNKNVLKTIIATAIGNNNSISNSLLLFFFLKFFRFISFSSVHKRVCFINTQR